MQAGERLKSFRNRYKITVRQVESASARIAAAKGDKRFRISNSWLAQLENSSAEPGICKLFSLSAIYNIAFCDLVQLYDVDIAEIEKYRTVAEPSKTQLLEEQMLHPDSILKPEGDKTSLVRDEEAVAPPLKNAMRTSARNVCYGYIGMSDLTMYPLIRPGSYVCIDATQTKLQPGGWRNEYERPIYFVEMRGGFVCSWCEVDAGHLLIIPHHSSPQNIRRLAYPREAEIVGRVTSFNTRCVE
jgi:transcriptional regulator with XRE-family HTH domain